ncbi:MAG: serine/threonine-protein kinase [Kofleriaceae bacterium]
MDEVSTLGSMGAVLRELASAPADLFVRGTLIDGQFEIERVLGSGAMGVVYLARDRRLERNVAIKLVKDQSPHALARASREAVSLARLSHPNVVVIHQVGEIDGKVYVAMEYVAGKNAREWAKAETRSIQDVLAVYREVGEGLAAAHAAGLVHRDFKPDNVLVGEDGRARVADFGLARSESSFVPAVGTGAMTQLAGTPAYMPPEQTRGEEIDARADQYAFCATVWEALHGVRPFDYEPVASGKVAGNGAPFDSTIAASSDIVTNAPTLDTPTTPKAEARPKREPRRGDRKVPRRIELVLLRGLADDREDRWPAMRPLLDALRADHKKRNGSIALGVGVLAIGGVAFAMHGGKTDPCESGAAQIRESWNPAAKDRVIAALAPVGAAPWVVAQATATTQTADAWSERWGTSYRSVCHSGWASTLAERGTICLARARHELASTVEALASGKVAPENIARALDQLPRSESCTDPVYVSADTPPPSDPATAAAVEVATSTLHRTMLEEPGTAASAVLDSLEQQHLAYPPLVAEIHEKRGTLAWANNDKHAIELMRDAYFEARDASARAVAANAALELVPMMLNATRDQEAAMWSRLGTVEATAIADPWTQSRALSSQGLVATAQNQPDQAIALQTRAIAIAKQANLSLAQLYEERGDSYDHAGKPDLAIADYEAGMAALRAKYGEVHPRMSIMLQKRSLSLIKASRVDESVKDARKAMEIATIVDPKKTDIYANAQGSLGVALTEAHQYDEALKLLDDALSVETTRDPHGYNTASDHNNRCELLGKMRRHAEALAECKLSETMFVAVVGADSTEVASTEINAAVVQLETDPAAAIESATRAFAALKHHDDDGNTILPLLLRATAYRMTGQWGLLKADLDAAEPLVGKAGGQATPFEYARERAYLCKHDHDPKQREYAVTARDGFAKIGEPESAAEATKLIP